MPQPADIGRFFTSEEVLSGYLHHHLVQPDLVDPWLGNARALAKNVLDPWRKDVGPIKIDCWWRNEAYNSLVDGAARHSQHLQAQAADCAPLVMNSRLAFEKLRVSDLPYDQIIFYPGRGFIHVSHIIPHDDHDNRREVLVCVGPKSYRPYAVWLASQ